MRATPNRFCKLSRWGSLSAFAAMLAFLAASTGANASAAAASDGPTVVTSTGVHTHGSIKTTQYTVGWLLRCAYSKTLSDDPIVRPNMPGMSHNHDFFGNTSTNARSTYKSMVASKTTCGTAADTASYWQPTLRELVHGAWQTVLPNTTGQQIYYRGRYASGVKVTAMPADLRIVTGNAMAKSAAGNPALAAGEIRWECAGGGSDTQYAAPPLTCGSNVIEEVVSFPSCWDGVLTHANDSAHVAYAPDMGRCPSAFPIAMPRISLRVKFPVSSGTTSIALSSGAAYTAHADFWNTWQQSGLTYLVSKCINAGVSCGTSPIAPMG